MKGRGRTERSPSNWSWRRAPSAITLRFCATITRRIRTSRQNARVSLDAGHARALHGEEFVLKILSTRDVITIIPSASRMRVPRDRERGGRPCGDAGAARRGGCSGAGRQLVAVGLTVGGAGIDISQGNYLPERHRSAAGLKRRCLSRPAHTLTLPTSQFHSQHSMHSPSMSAD